MDEKTSEQAVETVSKLPRNAKVAIVAAVTLAGVGAAAWYLKRRAENETIEGLIENPA